MSLLITTIRYKIDITISSPIRRTIVRFIYRYLRQVISINIYNINVCIFFILLR